MAKKPTLEDTLKVTADGTAPQVSVSIMRAAKRFADKVDLELIEKLISQGALDRLDLYLPWDQFNELLKRELGEHLITGIRNGANAAQAETQRAAKTALGIEPELTFDATNPRVRKWIQKNTGRLITVIGDEARGSIKDTVRDAMREELPPIEVHRRIKGVIGLNRPQARALSNYRAGLIASGVPKAKMNTLVNRYRDEQLAYRANMIARTEMMGAVNQGHLEGQRQAVESGLIPGNAYKKWVTAPEDDRLCPTCRNMKNETIPLDNQFNVTIYSGKKVVGRAKVDTPPVHPHCRCTHILVIK